MMTKKTKKTHARVDKPGGAKARRTASGTKPHPAAVRAPWAGEHTCAAGCGYPVKYAGTICGECACEDDCAIW